MDDRPARAEIRMTERVAALPPRWARRAAAVAALTTVPSGLWRTAMALGAPLGVVPAYRQEHYGFPGWGTAYVIGLTVFLSDSLSSRSAWSARGERWHPGSYPSSAESALADALPPSRQQPEPSRSHSCGPS